ncbi:MAG: hypothetical protein ACRDHZ_25105 [Ktedonobacteraceae bacterium]
MTNQPYPPNSQAPSYPHVIEPIATPPPTTDNTIQSVNSGGSVMESRHENYVDSAGNQVESRMEVYDNKNISRANISNLSTAVIYFILGALEVILGLRFIFRLLGASVASDFTTFLYNLSHGFIIPFNGIFNDQTLGTRSVFELSTLVAMLIYALIAWGLVTLCRVLFAPIYSSRQQSTITRRR